MAALGEKVRCKMTDTALVEIGTAVMAVIVVGSFVAVVAYMVIAKIEEGGDDE
jgi:hypothetical protein